MTNLKHKLLKEFGYNRLCLQHAVNSDTVLYICIETDVRSVIFGEIRMTENGWELVGYDLEIFKVELHDYLKRKETIHISV